MDQDARVRLGIIGIGGRALGLMDSIAAIDEFVITGLCDIRPECCEKGLKWLREHDYPTVPFTCTDARELLDKSRIDAAIIATSWNEHVELAIAAMEAGIPVGFEVGGASSLDQCWELVKTYERTRTPCMMLENCCFGRYEMAVLRMIRDGLFGEVVHCEGGYQHFLGKYIVSPESLESGHQRSFHHMHRNGELYPTHEIGPISKYLNINRGNRFLTLSSFASKAASLNALARENFGEAHEPFMLGDFVTTVLKCAGGETVMIAHDTSLPRPYSRGNVVHGTRGIWMEINHSIYIEGLSPESDKWEDIAPYLEKYDHPIWKQFLADGVQGGHDGMDYLELKAFAHSVLNGVGFPLDVYDAACWMAITILSENSVAMGGAPQPFPDFTNGKWVRREPLPDTPYLP